MTGDLVRLNMKALTFEERARLRALRASNRFSLRSGDSRLGMLG
jgi:hypothetical protein